MKNVVLIFTTVFLFSLVAFADDIKLDGDFSDWVDKPTFNSEQDIQTQTDPKPTEEAKEKDIQIDEEQPTPTNEEQPTPTDEKPIEPDVQPSPEASVVIEPQTSAAQEAVQPTPTSEQGVEQASKEEIQEDQESINSQDNKNGPKFKIHQLSWHLSSDDKILYIMARLSHPEDINTGSVSTRFITDFGEFNSVTTYDTGDGSALTLLNGLSIEEAGKCEIINKNTIEIEYGIPLEMLIKDIKWGYLIKFMVTTEDDEEPDGSYITVSTASTAPFIGIGLCAAVGFGIPYLMKKKRIIKQ